jgi:hypothetical protein
VLAKINEGEREEVKHRAQRMRGGGGLMRPLILATDEQNARAYVRASKDERRGKRTGQTSGTTLEGEGEGLMRPLLSITDEQNGRVYVRASKD